MAENMHLVNFKLLLWLNW